MDPRRFVEKHGIVLASARHAVAPSIAGAIAGGPIRGSWWGHPKGHEIFRALVKLDAWPDAVATRLIEGKLTYVHRRLWPALAALLKAGKIAAARLAKVEQMHTESGAHRTFETPAAKWLPKTKLPDAQQAVRQLGELADFIVRP